MQSDQLLNVNKSSGHRRVKSLVRELEEVSTKLPSPLTSTSTSTSPPSSPIKSLSTSGHVRKSASISYSSNSTPSSNTPTLSYTSTSPSLSNSGSSRNLKSTLTPDNLTTSASTSNSNKRKAIVTPSPIIVSRGGKEQTFTQETTMEPIVNRVILAENQQKEEEEIEIEEANDVFLPMSPNSATPYSVRFNNNNSSSSSNGSTSTTPAFQRPGEHTRKHSRIHERNLSAFFPRPGQEASGYGDMFEDSNSSRRPSEVTTIHTPPSPQETEVAAKSRRGHHHRHSLSHNFPSFLDPKLPPSDLLLPQLPISPSNLSIPAMTTLHGSNPSFLPVPTYNQNSKYSYLPFAVRFVIFSFKYLPLGTQFAFTLSCFQIILGATLWIAGQNGESLSVTGLGYLVVFDGMGGLSRIFVEGIAGVELLWSLLGGVKLDRSVRLPFGPHRLVTLSHFSQAIYLLFSAVYVCKESVEHVLLLHGPNEGDGGHGMGHGMGHSTEGSVISGTPTLSLAPVGIVLPVILLALSAVFSLVSAVTLKNHQQLADTVGPTGLSFSRPRSRSNEVSLFDLIGNPFTVTIVTFSLGLTLASYVIPVAQLGPLDKVVALLQSIAMFYIAYPAAVATGQVLLQTSPLNNGGQMDAFTNAIRDIENHPLVSSVSPPHLWQLTPHPSSSSQDKKSLSKNDNAGRRSSATTATQDSMIASTLIATLVIKVNQGATEAEILAISRFVKERCKPAMSWGGEEAIEGELTVEVIREKQQRVHGSHDHQHNHPHEHNHNHNHNHQGHSH